MDQWIIALFLIDKSTTRNFGVLFDLHIPVMCVCFQIIKYLGLFLNSGK